MQRLTIVIVLLLAGAAAAFALTSPEAVLERRPFAEFPRVLDGWTMVNEQRMGKSSEAMLQVDDYFMRTYANRTGDRIDLYIGYFTTQKEGKGIHSPRQCLPGAGWTALEASPLLLAVTDHNPGTIEVNRHLMAKGDHRELYLFWYQGRGRSYADEYLNKLYLIWDGLTQRRTDGALVRINSMVTSSPAKALETQTAFIRLIFPLLPAYIPN